MFKVSVIVCVYNMEKYIRECLDSLVNQTLNDIEIVIINDGSTDKSLSIIEEYCKIYSNIKLVNQKNKGLGGARNSGIDVATGEYVGFVDADDFVDKNMYELLYKEAKSKNSELVICDYEFYPKSVSNKRKWFKEYKGKLNAEFIDKNTQPWNKIVSRNLLNKLNFRFFDKNGDGAYINVFLNAKSIVTINNKLYYYRVGHESMSTNHNMDKYDREVNIALEQKKMLLRKNELVEELEEYFNYRIIYTCIQAITVAALLNNKKKFIEYKKYLTELKFKDNRYLYLLKENFGQIKYYGIVYILTINYNLSKILTKIVL